MSIAVQLISRKSVLRRGGWGGGVCCEEVREGQIGEESTAACVLGELWG